MFRLNSSPSSLSWWKLAWCLFGLLWSVALSTRIGKTAAWGLVRPLVDSLGAEETPLISKGIQVIGAGPGRTGTSSLAAALTLMGYRPYHMADCFIHGHAELWEQALTTGDVRPIIKTITDLGYNAIVDEPGTSFVPHFAQHFPEAKIILTHRRNETSKWIRSLGQLSILHGEMHKAPFSLIPHIRQYSAMSEGILASRGCSLDMVVPHGDPEGTCKAFYLQHMQEMKHQFGNNSSRFLEFHVSEGWGPLADFLGWQPPISHGAQLPPFPQSNGGDEVTRVVLAFRALRWLFYATVFMLFARVAKRCLVEPSDIRKEF